MNSSTPLSLTPLDLGAEMLAVVPARALSWHRVQLPPGTLARGLFTERSAPRLRAVLEGLLEDQLLDEPSQLHFALEPNPRDDAPIWVAVCHRQWLKDALKALRQAGQNPQRVIPEWAPAASSTPETGDTGPATRWITGDADAAQLVWSDSQGVHIWPLTKDETGSTLKHLQSLVPDEAELLAEPAVAQWAEQLFNRAARAQSPAQRLSDAAQTEWNLAQFDLARRNPWLVRVAGSLKIMRRAPQWRAARWAVLGLLAVQVLGLNAYAWRTQTLLAQQRKSIQNTLTSTFPEVTVVVDAPLQMERALLALRQSSGSASPHDMEALLSAWGSLVEQKLVTSAPTAMDFMAGELRITAGSFDANQLTAIETALQTQGYSSQRVGDSLVLKARSTTP